MFMKQYAPNRCEPRIEVIVKMQQSRRGCEPTIEFIVKMQKKKVSGDQGGCETTIEVIVKMQKKKSGVRRVRLGEGFKIDVNQELKLL